MVSTEPDRTCGVESPERLMAKKNKNRKMKRAIIATIVPRTLAANVDRNRIGETVG
jgi:hypothetical protein